MTITSHQFDTNDYDPKRRSEMLHDLLGKMLLRVNLTPLQQDNWRARGVSRMLPGMNITDCTIDPIRFTRRTEHLADQNGDLIVAFLTTPFRISQPGRPDLDGRVGDVCFYTFDEPVSITLGARYSAHLLQLKRDQIASYVDNLDLRHRPLDASGTGPRLLRSYLATLIGSGTHPAAFAATAASHIRDLTALALGARADAGEVIRDGGVRAARLAAIHAHMARHFHEPDLSADRTAAALGITPRYVRRLLDEAGDSFSGRLADLRLEAAMRSLVSPLEAHRTIAEIAYSVGYTEFTTFFRHFRRRYGVSPSEARAKG
jgi:AraC-like DNA-binding protein